ncbi:hypothetical protein K6966_01825 [Enterobacter cloacae complex sp.]|nr:hypothetical protein K6966_01825 [Enterobacter cloacae complex sp.]
MTAINFPPLCRSGRIFTDFAMCNCFSKNLGLGEASARNGITGVFAGTGYLKFPAKDESGNERIYILQWGQVGNGGSGLTGSATFPIVFPSIFLGGAFGPFDTANGGFSVSFNTRTTSGFTAIFRDVSNATYPHVPARLQTSFYLALGY